MLQWRVRGSSGGCQSVGLSPPVLCSQVRARLKEQMGIAATPAVDLLLFSESQPEHPLPDSLLLHASECLLVQRRPASEAQAALKEAEVAYQRLLRERRDKDESLVAANANSAGNPATSVSSSALQVASASATNADCVFSNSETRGPLEAEVSASSVSAPVEDVAASAEEERLLLQAVMAVHDSRKGYLREEDAGTKGGVSKLGVGAVFASTANSQQASSAATTARIQTQFFQQQQMLQQQSQQQQQQQPHLQASVSVPSTYICHMCGEAGHHIRVCPKANDQKTQKKIRPATGIPSSFLRDIAPEDIAKHQQVFIKKDGSFAVMRSEAGMGSLSTFNLAGVASSSVCVSSLAEWTAHLKCGLCRGIFSHPTSTPCCGETFCRSCIVIYLQQHPAVSSTNGATPSGGGKCPSCGSEVRLADLASNAVLQQSVKDVTDASSAGAFRRPPLHALSSAVTPASGNPPQSQRLDSATTRDNKASLQSANVVSEEEPAKGSLADLLQRSQLPDPTNAKVVKTEAGEQQTAAASTSPTSGFVKTEVSSEQGYEASREKAGSGVLALKSEGAVLSFDSSDAPEASSREASFASAPSDASAPADDSPQLSDLLHFKIPVAQILESGRAQISCRAHNSAAQTRKQRCRVRVCVGVYRQHKIAEEYIANYRKRKAEAAASAAP